MEVINQIFAFIGKLFEWWFLVMPWEQAIFVRAGSKIRLLNSGIYFKIPFLDTVFVQTTRMRMIDLPVQTVSTIDGKTVTIKSAVGYSIGDISKLYNTMSHPEITLASMVLGEISEYMRNTKSEEATPKNVEDYVKNKLNGDQFGLREVSIRVTSWADVKTFRLIQDASWMQETLQMTSIK